MVGPFFLCCPTTHVPLDQEREFQTSVDSFLRLFPWPLMVIRAPSRCLLLVARWYRDCLVLSKDFGSILGCLLLLGFGPENAEPVLLSSIGSRNIKHLAIMLFLQFCGPELVCSQFPPSRVLLWLPFTLFAEFILREEEQEIRLCHFIQTGSL